MTDRCISIGREAPVVVQQQVQKGPKQEGVPGRIEVGTEAALEEAVQCLISAKDG